jgi:hypothetical protein
MSHLHFFAQAGHHRFVSEHKHTYRYMATTGMMFRNYHFECTFDKCYHREVISKHFFWHGTPKLVLPKLPTIDYSAPAMKKAMQRLGSVIQVPPPDGPSSHYTLRTDGTIEDHTPWLNQGPKNNQNFLGVEGSWRVDD